jgi:hypothetical protein
MEKFGRAVKEMLEKHVNRFGDTRESLAFWIYFIYNKILF